MKKTQIEFSNVYCFILDHFISFVICWHILNLKVGSIEKNPEKPKIMLKKYVIFYNLNLSMNTH